MKFKLETMLWGVYNKFTQGVIKMENTKLEEAKERIIIYYRELIDESYPDDEAKEVYKNTLDEVMEQLLPYAMDGNYWWEKNDVAMAYYQIHNKILVVRTQDFEKRYKELMGKKFDYMEFADPRNRAAIIKLAETKFNKKKGR